MRGKLLFVAGAAVGYVLGARAGRKRYEQIKSAAARVWETPGIQRQVNAVEDYAAEKFGELPGALFEGTKKVVTTVVNRAQNAQKQNAQNQSAQRQSAQSQNTTYTPSVPTTPPAPTSRTYTSSVTIAAPPDEETANAPTTPPKAAASKASTSAASPKKRKATPAADIDEADDAGA
jgi:oxygen-dependent protoporphyrinogen oxidase